LGLQREREGRQGVKENSFDTGEYLGKPLFEYVRAGGGKKEPEGDRDIEPLKKRLW